MIKRVYILAAVWLLLAGIATTQTASETAEVLYLPQSGLAIAAGPAENGLQIGVAVKLLQESDSTAESDLVQAVRGRSTDTHTRVVVVALTPREAMTVVERLETTRWHAVPLEVRGQGIYVLERIADSAALLFLMNGPNAVMVELSDKDARQVAGLLGRSVQALIGM